MSDAGSAWLESTWGKFRNYERTTTQRLDRPALQGAHAMWAFMVESRSPDGPPAAAEVERFLAGLTDAQRGGAGAFAVWIKENAEALKLATLNANSGDGAHTTDAVFAQIIR